MIRLTRRGGAGLSFGSSGIGRSPAITARMSSFFVCTHIDKGHIHNHIYYNSTAQDCSRKFHNFIGPRPCFTAKPDSSMSRRNAGKSAGFFPRASTMRQAFPPGEVTPEEANKIGYETAMRWTKGKYQFFVCTHIDKGHAPPASRPGPGAQRGKPGTPAQTWRCSLLSARPAGRGSPAGTGPHKPQCTPPAHLDFWTFCPEVGIAEASLLAPSRRVIIYI